MNAPAAVLELRDVSKRFRTPSGFQEVLRGANLSIEEGEFVAITGPSGSGKTTLLHLAALLDGPSSGKVFFDGQDAAALEDGRLSEIRRTKIGMVFQKGCLLPHRSALENVRLRFRYSGCGRSDAQERSASALEAVGLGHVADRPARLLSGGEAGRVGIARAVAVDPRLIIADEPTGNLDPASTDSVMDCLRRSNRRGAAILMATHNPALLDYCSRRLICRGGVLLDRQP